MGNWPKGPLETPEIARARQAKAAEVTARFPGWRVWVADKGSPVATRTGNQRPPANDGTWARTVMADNWTELAEQLAEQAANDAAMTAAS